MNRRFARGVRVALTLAIVSSPAVVLAQWEPYPWKNVPRTADGKVDLKAPPRRTPDGKVDLSGFWMPTMAVRHLQNLAADLKPGEVPLQPWAEAVYKERIETNGKDHPGARCWPSGIPEKNNIPDGLKVVQTPDLMLFLHESRTIYRQIFTDGRPLPKDPNPSWNGYSIGRWEGDALVVQTNGLRDDTWLDRKGSPLTDVATLTERFRRVNYGRLEIDVTVNDPKAYTRPWTVKLNQLIVLNTELLDYHCLDNERDRGHMVGK